MKRNSEKDQKGSSSLTDPNNGFFKTSETVDNLSISNPYQNFAQLLLGSLKPIVGNAYFLSSLNYKFQHVNYPEYNSWERHGQWGQSKHVRWGKIKRSCYPLYSFNHVQPLGQALPQFSWYPSLQYVGLATSIEASFHVEVGPVVTQSEHDEKEVLLSFNVVPPGLREVRYIQGDGPRNVPSRTIEYIRESVLNATCRDAYNHATRAVESSSAQHIIITGFLNTFLTNILHYFYWQSGNRLKIRVLDTDVNTEFYQGYIIIRDHEITPTKVGISIHELVVGTSLWLTDSWLVAVQLQIVGNISIDNNLRVTHDLGFRIYGSDRPLVPLDRILSLSKTDFHSMLDTNQFKDKSESLLDRYAEGVRETTRQFCTVIQNKVAQHNSEFMKGLREYCRAVNFTQLHKFADPSNLDQSSDLPRSKL